MELLEAHTLSVQKRTLIRFSVFFHIFFTGSVFAQEDIGTSAVPFYDASKKSPPKSHSSDCASGPDTCKQGFVWREANERDHVCVKPKVREQTKEENRLATSRRAGGGSYGPNTCKQGFVWREAFEGDVVCVTVESRTNTARDNQQKEQHRACRQ